MNETEYLRQKLEDKEEIIKLLKFKVLIQESKISELRDQIDETEHKLEEEYMRATGRDVLPFEY